MKAKELIEHLNEAKTKEAMTSALELAIANEAIKDYAGYPLKEFKGDIKQLAKEMMRAEANYEHDLVKWQSKTQSFTEWQVTKTRITSWFSSWGAILGVILILGIVFIIK